MKLEEMSNEELVEKAFDFEHVPMLNGTCRVYPSEKEIRTELLRRFAALTAERDNLLNAITWALGAGDDFPERQKGEGAYWWRKKLREMAGLEWNGSEYVKKEQRC